MNILGGKGKRIGIILMALLIISTQGTSVWTADTAPAKITAKVTAPEILNLQAALNLAFKNNKTIQMIQNQWQAKQLEIGEIEDKIQALAKRVTTDQGLGKDQTLAKDQSGLDLVSLEMLEIEESKRLPSIEKVTLIKTLSQKQDELSILEQQYDSAVNNMIYNVKILFYDILENTDAYNYEIQNSEKLETVYLEIYPQYLEGLVKSEVVKGNRENYKASQERQVKTLLALDQLKAKLTTQLGGVDIGSWTYEGKLPEYTLSEADLELLYPYAVHHDGQLLGLEKNFNIAQCQIEEINEIYLKMYGPEAEWIAPAIRVEKVDFPQFFEKFKTMKDKAASKTYPLRFGVYKVDGASEYFKEKPAALTLMEEQSPLITALAQRDEKKGLVAEGYTTLQKNYRAAYEAYQQLSYDLNQLREDLIVHTALLEKLKKSNLEGMTHYLEVQALMLKVSDEKRSERLLQIKKNKSLAELDFVSSGAISNRLILKDFETIRAVVDPKGVIVKEGVWKIETPNDFYGFVFSLKLPDNLKISHYQVIGIDGKPLSNPMWIGEPLKHAPLKYIKNGKLKIVLYQKDKVVKTVEISAEQVSGRF